MTDYFYFIFDLPRRGSPSLSEEIRRNLNALAQNNYTVSEDLPKNPRNGMFRFNASDPSNIRLQYFYESSWRTLYQNLEEGGSGALQTQRKSQTFVDLAVWTFDHNLGQRPIVQVVNSAGEVVLPSKIEHASENRVIVTHASNQTGEIIVVG